MSDASHRNWCPRKTISLTFRISDMIPCHYPDPFFVAAHALPVSFSQTFRARASGIGGHHGSTIWWSTNWWRETDICEINWWLHLMGCWRRPLSNLTETGLSGNYGIQVWLHHTENHSRVVRCLMGRTVARLRPWESITFLVTLIVSENCRSMKTNNTTTSEKTMPLEAYIKWNYTLISKCYWANVYKRGRALVSFHSVAKLWYPNLCHIPCITYPCRNSS